MPSGCHSLLLHSPCCAPPPPPPLHSLPATPQAINLAAGGNGTALTPQDIAMAAAQHARLQPQPPSMQVAGGRAWEGWGHALAALQAISCHGMHNWHARSLPMPLVLKAEQQAAVLMPPCIAASLPQELHALARKINAQPLTGPSDKQHGIKLPPGEKQ